MIAYSQFRAKLIFRTLISDDRAVGIEDKSLSLMSRTFSPWHKNNCRGSSVICGQKNKNQLNPFKNELERINYSLDWRTGTVLQVFVHIGTHQPVHRAASDGHSPKR